MNKLILLTLLLSGCIEGYGGGLHAENDFFDPFHKNNDSYYTHGTQFDLTKESDNELQTYSIGQTIYTPSTKKPDASPEVLKRDRPYAGWLFGEYRDTQVVSDSLRDTVGIQLGCVGPCSYAKQTQQGVHKLLGQGKPAWLENDSLRSEPGFIAEFEREKEVYATANSDIRVTGLGKLGNIVDSFGVASTLRVGWNLDQQIASPIVFKLPKEPSSKWLTYFFARAEQRAVLYNHLLDGSLWQTEPHTVDSNPLVTEFDLGFVVGYGKLKFQYRVTRFSSEWSTQKSPFNFGSVNFSW